MKRQSPPPYFSLSSKIDNYINSHYAMIGFRQTCDRLGIEDIEI